MTKFNDLFTAIVSPALNDGPGGHGEEVVYVPHNRPERTITVRVDRQRRIRLDSGQMVEAVTFTASNSETTGIARTEFKEGKDMIRIAIRRGGVVQLRTIGAILEEVGGDLEFKVG